MSIERARRESRVALEVKGKIGSISVPFHGQLSVDMAFVMSARTCHSKSPLHCLRNRVRGAKVVGQGSKSRGRWSRAKRAELAKELGSNEVEGLPLDDVLAMSFVHCVLGRIEPHSRIPPAGFPCFPCITACTFPAHRVGEGIISLL